MLSIVMLDVNLTDSPLYSIDLNAHLETFAFWS